MHLIQIIRSYLGLSQQELAKKVGITQADLCEMEIKTPYGRIEKYQRLSDYLGIPIHALVNNDCTRVPLSFFESHPHAPYAESAVGCNLEIGRHGEEAALEMERKRLGEINPSLARLVLPHFKLRNRPGYDILSFDDSGKPIYIEVKTSIDDSPDFFLTKQEYQKANKVVSEGETYLIYRYTNWGKPCQELLIYNFREMKEQCEFSPATYMFTSKDQEPVISGIRYWRKKRGLSKNEFSDCLGIKTPDLWRYETGKRNCPVGMYQKMASILEVTIDQLIKEHPAI